MKNHIVLSEVFSLVHHLTFVHLKQGQKEVFLVHSSTNYLHFLNILTLTATRTQVLKNSDLKSIMNLQFVDFCLQNNFIE